MSLPEPYRYESGYIHIPLKIDGLPEAIEISGMTLLRKSEFHCSLLSVKSLTPQLEDRGYDSEKISYYLIEVFTKAVKDNPISLRGFIPEYHCIKRDTRASLVVKYEVAGLEQVFAELSRILQFHVPVQLTHVTIYTLQPDKGIGINSESDLNDMSQAIEPSELQDIKEKLDRILEAANE